MAHDVFISYSSEDKPTADAVCAALEAKGIRCWIAPRDILPGAIFAEALIGAINASRLFVLVFSARSNDSPHVMRELERAVHKGLPILPLRIEDVPLSPSMEYFISTPHWLDALTPPLQQHLAHLTETVRLLLSRTEVAAAEAAGAAGTAVAEPGVAAVPSGRAVGGTRPWTGRPVVRRAALVAAIGVPLLLVVLMTLGSRDGTRPPVQPTPSPEGSLLQPTTSPEGSLLQPTGTPGKTPSAIELGEVLATQGSKVTISSAGDKRILRVLTLGDVYGPLIGASWSPDGSHFVFAACPVGPDPALLDLNNCDSNLYISDRSGNQVTTLDSSKGFENEPAWSPDGQWISFESDGLEIIQSDGKGRRSIKSLTSGFSFPGGPSAWSPDSQRIAWISPIYSGDKSADHDNWIMVFNRDGSRLRYVYRYIGADTERIAWSPDGQRLALETSNGSFYLLDVNCKSGPAGWCDESALTKIEKYPEHWRGNFYPQWAGEELVTKP
jgi:hypothetical protein